jgi:hypothetical protein
MTLRSISLGLLLGLAALAPAYPRDEKPAEKKTGAILLVDAAGKEHKVTGYRITAGTRRLAWLAPAKVAPDVKAPKGKRPATATEGPEALVVRDDASIRFLEGVVTLVPLTQLRAVRFDAEKGTMTVVVAVSAKAEEDVSLSGTTKYKGINKLTLEAELDKGDAGVATLTYQGGVVKGGIRSVTFPAPKVEGGKAGRPAIVVSQDDDVKKTHKVSDLMALYRLPSGGEKLLPTLQFKKTLKLDFAKLETIAVSSDKDTESVWQVVQKDGDESSLTPLGTLPIDGQTATLVGLVGKVPAGYKLFPLRRIHTITFDSTDEPKEPAKPKDDSR